MTRNISRFLITPAMILFGLTTLAVGGIGLWEHIGSQNAHIGILVVGACAAICGLNLGRALRPLKED
jgi:hypothetical protein